MGCPRFTETQAALTQAANPRVTRDPRCFTQDKLAPKPKSPLKPIRNWGPYHFSPHPPQLSGPCPCHSLGSCRLATLGLSFPTCMQEGVPIWLGAREESMNQTWRVGLMAQEPLCLPLSLCPSVYPSVSVSLFVYYSVFLPLCLCLSSALYLSPCLSVSPCVS